MSASIKNPFLSFTSQACLWLIIFTICSGVLGTSVSLAQSDVLGNLTPEQLAQFNQLPPAQRQAIMSQMQLGSSAGLDTPVSQPQTVFPRGIQSMDGAGQSSLNLLQSDIDARNSQRNSRNNEYKNQTDRERLKRKARQLYDLGLSLEELDVYGELSQMGILDEIEIEDILMQARLTEANSLLVSERNMGAGNNFGQLGPSQTIQFTSNNIESDDNDDELRPFGYELFAGSPSTFAPATDIPVPLNYVVGPGDTVVIQLYGQRNERYELAVSREGVIQFPNVGPLNVSGLSFEDMRELVQTTVNATLIGQDVSVTMGALRSIQIFMLGEVYRPGVYTVSSLATMTNALFASGGVSNLGSLRNIQLLRSGELVTTLDLYDLLLNGDTSNDSRLQPNDVIFIDTVGRTVGLSGEVRRPGIFELEDEETVGDILSLAGGLLPTAYLDIAHLERINTLGQRTIVDISLIDNASLNSVVRDGDLLYVDSILDQIESSVQLEGHVNRPGSFAWEEGMRVSDLVSMEDLLSNPDLNYALIVRETQPSRNIEIHQLELGSALNVPGSLEDVVLQPRDRLLVFGENSLENRLDRRLLVHPLVQTLGYQSRENNQRKVVAISGQVNAPGEYPLVEDMNISDLVFAGGGAAENAYNSQAELTRRLITEESGMIFQNRNLDLNDSLVLNSSLNPLDRLTVRKIPNWGELETVTISGEVLSPGTYVIGKEDSLRDLILRAGGLTDFADPKAAIFLREELRVNEQRLLDDFNERLTRDLLNQSLTQSSGQIQQPQLNTEVINALLAQIESAVPTGRLVIDLPGLLNGDDREEVILREGDELLIPRTRQEVAVIGEVQFATSHLFSSGDTVNDYINRSGGFTRNADEDNVFVIKANGEVLPYARKRSIFSFTDDQISGIEPGDSIVVPYYARLNNPLVTWMNISTVLFNLASTLLVIERAGN